MATKVAGQLFAKRMGENLEDLTHLNPNYKKTN
jgi:hypothetical protein